MLEQVEWDQDILQEIFLLHILIFSFDQQMQKELDKGVFRAVRRQNLEVEKHLKKADRSLLFYSVLKVK